MENIEDRIRKYSHGSGVARVVHEIMDEQKKGLEKQGSVDPWYSPERFARLEKIQNILYTNSENIYSSEYQNAREELIDLFEEVDTALRETGKTGNFLRTICYGIAFYTLHERNVKRHEGSPSAHPTKK